MSYDLADGISFCRTGDRLVFLDLVRDRYLALPSTAEPAFERLVAGEPLSGADRTILDRLELLAAAPPGTRLSPCRAPEEPERSLATEGVGVSQFALAEALARIAVARFELRNRPFRQVLGRLERRIVRSPRQNGPVQAAASVAAAFRRSALVASPLDQCLPRSIAAAYALLARGIRPELVIGVSARPFAAHCWVQCGPLLVTGEMDEVANFTPILVL